MARWVLCYCLLKVLLAKLIIYLRNSFHKGNVLETVKKGSSHSLSIYQVFTTGQQWKREVSLEALWNQCSETRGVYAGEWNQSRT